MFGNRLLRLITLGIIFLSLAGTGWGEEKPAWGDPGSGLILKYRLPQDRVLKYRANRDLLRNVKSMGQSVDTTLKTDYDYGIQGTGFDKQNNLLVRISIDDIGFVMNSPQGDIKPNISVLKGKSFVAIHSPNGKQLEVTGVEELPRVILAPGADMNIADLFKDILPRLPDTSVKTGESWTAPIDKTAKTGQTLFTYKGKATSVLEGVETLQGMECVKIKTQTESTVEGAGAQMGQVLNINGEITATTIWYFAYKKGLFIESMTDFEEVMTIKMGEMEMPRTTKGKIDTKLVL